MTIEYRWRGPFANREVSLLHAEGFQHRYLDDDWNAMLERHSVGWVTARDDDGLVGFVNAVWDGGVHAFLEDTLVAARARRRGVGRRLVEVATAEARAAGCEWLHVDFEDDLKSFYVDACGFVPTNGGLIQLSPRR